ncbi:MAG TPA: ABC transporter substrate-binding protein [Anaerolineales bacterium]|nr:ABC transporter substrate-binding protein [Anaerolineales bacterium]
MSSKRLMMVVGVILAASMILSACAPAATPVATVVPGVTGAPTTVATEAPTAEPTMPPTTRHGGWLDEIDYTVAVTSADAVTQIKAGSLDLFSYGLASDKLAEIKDAGLCYVQSYGLYYDALFNPAVFTDATKLNPFSNRKIREAMNYVIDREYINQEIYAGGALAKFFPLTTQLVDYTDIIEVARGLEAKYAYNFEKGQEIVDAEMAAMGATKVDGKFMFADAPISLLFLIRNDGDGTRLLWGNYFADQLEKLGFATERKEAKSSELSPFWIGSNPEDGLWHVYTAGWGSSGLNRDERTIFQEMYLPSSAQGIPAWTYNVPDPVFQQVGDDLANGNYDTLQERHDLIVQALPLSLEDSFQVWIADLQVFVPFRCDLEVSADVGAGVETTFMSPYTMRYTGIEGGVVKTGTTDTLFTDPWNPINGSNWVSSAYAQNATGSRGLMPDPYTGLAWPLRAEKADLVVQTGIPVQANLDWVTLSFVDEITVPIDAWVDWDPATQLWVTAGEKFPDGVTAKMKSTIYYPADLFTTVKWHDGSFVSVADFVMYMIESFDYSKEGSAIFDEDTASNLEAFLSAFKGVQITSTDPLTIDTYSDNVYADAELDITSWWPTSTLGEASWPVLSVGNLAVANQELAWGTGQADRWEVEWMSLVAGPSLPILVEKLDQAIADNTIPYAPTMAAYLTADEATARYAALKTFYETYGHFWVGTGPYYLASADLNAGSVVVKNNFEFADLADRWSRFSLAPLGVAALEGPAQVKIGAEAVFTATFTLKSSGDAYPTADTNRVKFLVYDAEGLTIYVGEGVAAGSDGVFTLTIPADITSKLVAGTGSIEVAGVFIPVAIPAFTSLDYVVVP